MLYFFKTTITIILLLSVCAGQVDLDSSKLPIISIETGGPFIMDDPRINAHMKVIHDPDKVFNYSTDTPTDYNGLITIEIRGSSSQDVYPKKSYGFETVTLAGENNNVSILGLPRENDWILYAPYADKSLIRNALSYKISRAMGRWASRTRFCELLINGRYLGVYVLMEKLKRDKNRLDITEMTPDDIQGDALTGGYIVKLDKFTGSGGAGWTGHFEDFFQFEYPKARDIRTVQEQYIEDYITAFEKALASPAFRDPEEGYLRFIERASFIDMLIISELTKNVDAYRLSTFMHKERDSKGGKLRMGPVWDYNFTFGNVNYCTGSDAAGWVLNFNRFCPDDNWIINPWWDRLLTDKDFVDELKTRWFELREETLHTAVLLACVDSMVEEIGDAADRNFQRWNILGNGIWPNAFVGDTWQEEIDFMKNWLEERLEWMDANIADIGRQVSGPYSSEFFNLGPNPFQGETRLRFRLGRDSSLEWEIRSMDGRVLRTMEFKAPAAYDQEWIWDGADVHGRLLPAGMYIYTLRLNGEIREVGKLSKY